MCPSQSANHWKQIPEGKGNRRGDLDGGGVYETYGDRRLRSFDGSVLVFASLTLDHVHHLSCIVPGSHATDALNAQCMLQTVLTWYRSHTALTRAHGGPN
jgi:hypothetical protein